MNQIYVQDAKPPHQNKIREQTLRWIMSYGLCLPPHVLDIVFSYIPCHKMSIEEYK